LARLDELAVEVQHDLAGLRRLLSQEYVIQMHARDARRRIEQLGRQRQLARRKEAESVAGERGRWSNAIKIPRRITSTGDLDGLIQRLQALRPQSQTYADIEIIIQFED
jgi:hypothetical protein